MKHVIVAVINQKGGVGKTTTSINLACGIAMLGRKVLMVDFDPQAHASIVLRSIPDSCLPTMQDVLVNREKISEVIIKTSIENLDLAPSDIRLDKAEQLLVSEMFRETRLSKALSGLDYEFTIINCRPTLGLLSVNAIYACDIVLIPCETARFSLEGFSDLLNMLRIVRKDDFENGRCVPRILLCKFDARKMVSNEWVLKQLEPYASLVFKTRIRQCEALNQAHMARESIFAFKSASNGAEDYARLTQELMILCAQPETN